MFTMQALDRPKANQKAVLRLMLFQDRIHEPVECIGNPQHRQLVALIKGAAPMDQ